MAVEQLDFRHRLPRTSVVDRLDFLTRLSEGKSVIHVGFTDLGCRSEQDIRGTWLHERLAGSASRLVGIDLDQAGVERARRDGYAAFAVDCTDAAAVKALGIAPAELVIAGEVIEHVSAAGPFLDGLRELVAPGGALCLTTPNAYSLVGPMAALMRTEVMHPDHVALYSWRSLTALLGRHGWDVVESLTYSSPKAVTYEGATWGRRLGMHAFNTVLSAQGVLARLGASFLADGLIVVCRPSHASVGTSEVPSS